MVWGWAGRRRRRRAGYRKFSTVGIEAVESRILLSTDPVSDITGAVSNPDADADLATQITTYSDESTDLAESYALDVEEAYLDATKAELESEMLDFFGEAAEAIEAYDPYAGLDETPIADYLSDYDDELANLESSSSSGTSTQDATTNLSVSSTGETDASGQDDSTGEEDGSIFDYDNQISSYAEQVITETLTESSPGEEEGAIETTSSGASSDSSTTGTSDSTTSDSTTSDSTTSDSTTSDSTTSGSTTSGSTTSGSTSADGTSTSDDTDEFVNPFVVPEGLEVSGVELPDEVTGDVDLLTVAPTVHGSFTNVITGAVAPTVDPVNDPELGTGTTTSQASATLTTTQTWASPTDWKVTHKLGSSFSINTVTIDAKGVSHGRTRLGSSTRTVTISSTGTSTFSYSASNSVTTTQSDGWDDSDILLGTTDKGGYSASFTVSSSLTFSSTDTLVTLPDGSPGRTTDVDFSLTDSISASFDASYELYEATGTFIAYGRDPVTNYVVWAKGSISGSGEELDASGGFNVYGGTTATTWMNSSATYPDGGEIQDSHITGTAGFDSTITSGGGVSQEINYESQEFSGTLGTENEVYEFIALDFTDSAGGSTTTTVNASFDIDAPVPTTSSTTTTAPLALTSTSTPPPSTDGIDNAGVTHNDDGSTTFSLLVDIETPREFTPGSTTDWTQTVTSIDLQMTVTANISMGTFLDASGLPAGGITGNGTMSGSSSITFTYIDEHDPMNWVEDGWVVTTDISNWEHYQTQTIVADGTWTFGVGVTLTGDPTITGTWDGTLNYIFVDGSKNYVEFQKFHPVAGVWVSDWSEAEEKGVWTYDMTGNATDSGGQIGHLTSEQWTTTYTGSPPQAEPPLNESWNENLDNIQTVLDIAGVVPVIGEGADLLNTAIHLGRGNTTDALISLASMIPGGDALKFGKYGKKAAGALGDIGGALKSKLSSLKKKCSGSTCFIAGTQVVVGTDADIDRVEIALPEELLVEPVVDDNSSTTAAFMGAGVAIALVRCNLKTRRHRRRLLRRQPAVSENRSNHDSPHED